MQKTLRILLMAVVLFSVRVSAQAQSNVCTHYSEVCTQTQSYLTTGNISSFLGEFCNLVGNKTSAVVNTTNAGLANTAFKISSQSPQTKSSTCCNTLLDINSIRTDLSTFFSDPKNGLNLSPAQTLFLKWNFADPNYSPVSMITDVNTNSTVVGWNQEQAADPGVIGNWNLYTFGLLECTAVVAYTPAGDYGYLSHFDTGAATPGSHVNPKQMDLLRAFLQAHTTATVVVIGVFAIEVANNIECWKPSTVGLSYMVKPDPTGQAYSIKISGTPKAPSGTTVSVSYAIQTLTHYLSSIRNSDKNDPTYDSTFLPKYGYGYAFGESDEIYPATDYISITVDCKMTQCLSGCAVSPQTIGTNSNSVQVIAPGACHSAWTSSPFLKLFCVTNSNSSTVQITAPPSAATRRGTAMINGVSVTVDQNRMAHTPGDFDGDGLSDILWWDQLGTSKVPFEQAIWFMDSAALSPIRWSRAPQPSFPMDPSLWIVAGTGDFNGDGKADILWQNRGNGTSSKPGTGEVRLWLMDGSAVLLDSGTVIDKESLDWIVLGVGDFDGDGNADILWQYRGTDPKQTGDVVLWLMNGKKIRSNLLIRKNVDLSWKVQGIGDLNGDGRADIVWRNSNSNDGSVVVWLMNGSNFTLSPVTQAGVPSLNWTIQAVGDINGDGKADIIWREAAGEVDAWLMDGGKIVSNQRIYNESDLTWQIRGIGDYNGDGMMDLLWQKTDTGELRAWLMNGPTIAQNVGFCPSQTWQIVSK